MFGPVYTLVVGLFLAVFVAWVQLGEPVPSGAPLPVPDDRVLIVTGDQITGFSFGAVGALTEIAQSAPAYLDLAADELGMYLPPTPVGASMIPVTRRAVA